MDTGARAAGIARIQAAYCPLHDMVLIQLIAVTATIAFGGEYYDSVLFGVGFFVACDWLRRWNHLRVLRSASQDEFAKELAEAEERLAGRQSWTPWLGAALLLVFACTNPDAEQHRQRIAQQCKHERAVISEYAGLPFDPSEFRPGGVSELTTQDVERANFGLFSLGYRVYPSDRDVPRRRLTLGVLGRVVLTPDQAARGASQMERDNAEAPKGQTGATVRLRENLRRAKEWMGDDSDRLFK